MAADAFRAQQASHAVVGLEILQSENAGGAMLMSMTSRDYEAWHDEYDQPGSRLHLRLIVVQDLISHALDELPPGPIPLISMCAGQARDVITVARRHRRGRDLVGRLVELDPRNVQTARGLVEQHGLSGLDVVEGDAGGSDAYAGATPANLVIACGIFGNISENDIERTISFLPRLCGPHAWVVWTRNPSPAGIIDKVERWFADAGFKSEALVVPESEMFGVGAARLIGPAQDFEHGVHLFEFVR